MIPPCLSRDCDVTLNSSSYKGVIPTKQKREKLMPGHVAWQHFQLAQYRVELLAAAIASETCYSYLLLPPLTLS